MDKQTPSTTQTNANHASASTDAGMVSNVRSKINEGIDSATNKIGGAVEDRANAIATKTQDLLTSVAHGGQYLRESEPKTMGADLYAVVKRHPILSLAIGAGFGLLVAKIVRR